MGKGDVLTTAGGIAGECDQRPVLQFTGRRTLPEKIKIKKEFS